MKNDINITLESEQTKLQFKEKQIKHERMKLAKEKQLEMYKNMQMISEILEDAQSEPF